MNLKDNNITNKIGVVTGVADGIVNIIGLSNVSYGETIDIIVSNNITVVCLVLNLEMTKIIAIALDSDINLKPVRL
jgi:F0F1-type ATP synthase alpha subunit